MADRSPEGELEIAGGCLRFMHQCNWKMFVENLNDTMHPMVAHESSAGTAKACGPTSRPTSPSRWRSSSSCPSCPTTSSSRTWASAPTTTATASRACNFSIHSKYKAIPEYDDAMKAAYGEERTAQILGMARHNTVYYPNLTIKGAIQAIRVVQADLGRQDADRELDLPPQGRAARAAAAHHHVQPAHQLALLGRRPRRPAGLPRHPGRPACERQRMGQPAPQLRSRRRSTGGEITTVGTSELPMRNQYRSWARYMTETM